MDKQTFDVPLFEEDAQENVQVVGPDFFNGEAVDPEKDENEEEELESPQETPEEDTPQEDVPEEDEEEDIDPEEQGAAMGTYKTLLDKGYVSEREDFKGTFDELDKVFEEIPENIKNDLLAGTTVEGKQIMEFIMMKGNDLKDEDIKGFLDLYSAPAEVSNIDSAKAIITESLKANGLDDAELIESAIDILESRDETGEALLARARELSTSAKEDPDKVLERERAIEEQHLQAQRDFTTSVLSEVEEVKYSKKLKGELIRDYKQQKYVDVYTKAFQNPKTLVQLLTLSNYYDEKTGEFDFTTFVKQVASKDIEKAKQKGIQDNFSTPRSGTKSKKKGKSIYESDNIEFKNPY